MYRNGSFELFLVFFNKDELFCFSFYLDKCKRMCVFRREAVSPTSGRMFTPIPCSHAVPIHQVRARSFWQCFQLELKSKRCLLRCVPSCIHPMHPVIVWRSLCWTPITGSHCSAPSRWPWPDRTSRYRSPATSPGSTRTPAGPSSTRTSWGTMSWRFLSPLPSQCAGRWYSSTRATPPAPPPGKSATSLLSSRRWSIGLRPPGIFKPRIAGIRNLTRTTRSPPRTPSCTTSITSSSISREAFPQLFRYA